jgi:hypothetical protein
MSEEEVDLSEDLEEGELDQEGDEPIETSEGEDEAE